MSAGRTQRQTSMQKAWRAERGLADLLILRARWPDADPDLLADLLELQRIPEPDPVADSPPPSMEQQDRIIDAQQPDMADRRPAPRERPEPIPTPTKAVGGLVFYRVTKVRALPQQDAPGKRPQWYLDAAPIPPDATGRVHNIPPPPPLTPWRRLWPFFRAALGEVVEQRAPDLERLVQLSAQGRMPRRIPRRRRARWAPQAQVILDFSERHCELLGADVRGLIQPLLDLRGALGLDLLGWTDARIGPWLRFDVSTERFRRLETAPKPADAALPMLIVSDLGCCGGAADRTPWRDLLEGCRRAGQRPLVLSPCPSRYWHSELAHDCRLLTWDRVHRLPRVLPGRKATSAPCPEQPASLQQDRGAERLLDWLAPAVRIDPALLRTLRCLLGLDIGAEIAAWQHPHLAATSGVREWRDAAARACHEPGFRRLGPRRQQLLSQLLQQRHQRLPDNIRLEEKANLARLCNGEAPEVDRYLANMARTLEENDSPNRDALRIYLHRLHLHTAPEDWTNERRVALYTLLHREGLRRGELELPEGLQAPAYWLLEDDAEPRTCALVQCGNQLMLVGSETRSDPFEHQSRSEPQPEPQPGSLLAHLLLTDAPVQVQPLATSQAEQTADASAPASELESQARAEAMAQAPAAERPGPSSDRLAISRWTSHPADPHKPIALPRAGLVLRGRDAELTLEPLSRPSWTQRIGQDPAGLFVDVPHRGGSRRLRWVPPGPPLADAMDASVRMLTIPQDAFWDQDAWQRWRKGETQRADWAQGHGIDDIGPWAEFSVGGVVQRMRWIWPAAFWMGSPKAEKGREDDEILHQVLLTQGYWLADTACTQALWQQVMGDNPSRFIGADRPVEQVSWDQVADFIQELNRIVPGLDARLPTEAEWEHGCRAGNADPFWFGKSITTEQVNYDGNFPYGDAPKGQYRGETVPVKALPANAWGLYQMHGNVWEWCLDWYDAYDTGTVLDPLGPEAGDQRVCRGGCWINHAVLCRSAQRFIRLPDQRSGYLGFRLARGPVTGQATGAAEPSPEPENSQTAPSAHDAADAGLTKRERSLSGVGSVMRRLTRFFRS
ncbi:MAG: formylglycine-generating enzyme family protein [Thiohalocapsa sp. PB-PSB1]|jgi:formylglycine-generating enzyme required for sulfatase activity|nr:MAG: formylglycine-generating enzyme family protein [Thiohalocapsa sp. PB-PSB1]HCS89289.1 hypothetical protein [Chromatiaceae bacterium]